ncbi:hypothetical protein F5B17DRAFT_126412 [Nemania serpens]|nr:hypothetical protein F5B17DRAFT_126412 [Nemania serpens]
MRRTIDWDDSANLPIYLHRPLTALYVDAEDRGPLTLEAATNKPGPVSIDRSRDVLNNLLSGPLVEPPLDVSWDNFLYAMTGSGLFTAVKLYPFLWHVKRTGGHGGCILFLEYRYDGLIPTKVRTHYGRRLARALGSASEALVLC